MSLHDTGILLHLHFHKQWICSKPTWISWLINWLLTLYSTTKSRTSLPAAFVVGPLVLPREKYYTIQVRRCAPTNAQRVKSAMIALIGRTAFLRFYQKMSDWAYISILRSWIHCRIICIEYSEFCYLLCICTRENLLNIFIVGYPKDLLICFLI